MGARIVLLLIILTQAMVSHAKEAPEYYVIRANSDNVGISVKLNDIPICRFDTAGYYFSEVNIYLILHCP